MNSSFSPRPTSPIRRSKPPGEVEFNALFHLLPQPALLLDAVKEQVVQANSPFLQLTAFAVNEISGRAVRSLVSGLPSHALASDDILSVILDRRNRPPLPANLQVRALDSAGQWLALIFEPQEERHKSLVARLDQVLQAIVEVNCAPEEEMFRKTLERALGSVRNLLDLSAIALYRVNSGEPNSWKAAEVGEKGLLPDILPPADLLRLSQTYIWRPGRRVQTELHRLARMQNLTFLASTPTSPNGVLVLADRVQEPSEQLGIVLDALGKQTSAMMAHLAQVMDLRRLSLENRRELSIWRAVGENAQEGILLLSPQLTVTEMNPAAEWMLGYADWEVKDQPVESILIGPEQLASTLETANQGIPTHNMGNVSLHRRNGQSFPAHVQVIPVQREGETLAIIIFFSDVSEHEDFRIRTQQLEQRAVLGEVTAVFAHEVRNPINNISTGLQLLSVKLPENDPNQENISRLYNDCQRLNHLMESVLNFSRHAEHKMEDVDMEMLLKRLLDRWRPRFSKINIDYHFHIAENTPHVLGDPRSLEQVFTNLISNAVDAMSLAAKKNAQDGEQDAPVKGGVLAVQVRLTYQTPSLPQVEVSVSDTGPGIPDEVRDRIFEPFVTTKTGGTGLGLAITKRIVTAHHGTITVNTFPGGTVFHVFLATYQNQGEIA